MMTRHGVSPRCSLALAVAGFLLPACGQRDPVPAPAAVAPATPSHPWLGNWTGPEGTSLVIEARGAGYGVTVRNLDGPRTFEARTSDGRIVFERDGLTETIRSGTGVDTGMKWLAGKSDCLIVKAGEGYCRG